MTMWKSPLTSLHTGLARLNWRRRAKKKHTVGIRISNVAGFFESLNQAGVPYVVLRWFDDVPLSAEAEAQFGEDIDLLIDGLGLRKTLSIAFRHHGRIRCDLYSDSGMRGTTYHSMPYYPPTMAAKILSTRQWHERGFAVPNPWWHVLSLAYHLVYHKGAEAGIRSGVGLPVEPSPKREFERRFSQIAHEADVDLPTSLTLMELHEWLKSQHCSMPFDLLARWPRQSDWHQSLISHETASLEQWAARLPHLYLFLIREDADRPELLTLINEMLRARFEILDSVALSEQQVERAMMGIRGGSWIEHKRTVVVKPVRAIVCYDLEPQCVDDLPTSRDRLYPLVDNRNLFVKHEIRDALNRRFDETLPLHALHGADNAHESQHMIRVLWGDDAEGYNEQLLCRVFALQAGNVRKAA